MKVVRILSPFVVFGLTWWLLGRYSHQQQMVGAVFAATIALWITEVIPHAMTALLSTSLLVLVANVDEKVAYAAYGDPIIPLFMGSFILAKAMEKSGLSDRFAWMIMSQRWATRSPSAMILALGILTCVISLFVSNTATTAMFLPIGLSMLSALPEQRGKFPVAVMLMLTWGSSVAVGVPVGTPPNLITIGLIEKATNLKVGFGQWMVFAMPITVLMVAGSWLILTLLYGKGAPDTTQARAIALDKQKELGPMTAPEKHALIAFVVAFALWIVPDLSSVVLGADHFVAKWLQAHVTAAVTALVAAALLFIMPCKDPEHRLSWRTASSIDWGTIVLFGGGIALGQAMFSSGLARELGDLAAKASGANSLWTITALCTGAGILLSELASNTAAATTLVPVAVGLAQGAGVSPIAPALGCGIGASMGFMLPVSTAPNAIVYSSGLVPSKEMMKAGILIDVIGFVVILVGLRLILPLMGLS